MPLPPFLGLALIQGLTLPLPVGAAIHSAIVSRLLGWPPNPTPLQLAGQFGVLLGLLFLLRGDVWQLFRGVWRILSGQFRSREAKFLVNLGIAAVPMGIAKAAHLGALFAAFHGLRALALTGLAVAIFLWLADRMGMAIRRVEHLETTDALVIGIVQIGVFVPGVGLVAAPLAAARILGFERVDAARLALLLALAAVTGEVALGGWQAYSAETLVITADLAATSAVALCGTLLSVGAILAWFERGGLAPIAVYRLVVSAAVMAWLQLAA